MRFLVMVKSNEADEHAEPPSEEMFAAMAKYNEELVKAGVLLAGEGLLPSDKGAIVRFTNGEPTVLDGPFTEAKELVAGYWLFEVKSREEAIEWVKRVPVDPNVDGRIEIRQLLTADDFGAGFTDEIRERNERLQEQVDQQR